METTEKVLTYLHDAYSIAKRLDKSIARKSWEKDEFLFTITENTVPKKSILDDSDKAVPSHLKQFLQNWEGTEIFIGEYTCRFKSGRIDIPWLPTKEDLRATDWVVLENDNTKINNPTK